VIEREGHIKLELGGEATVVEDDESQTPKTTTVTTKHY
jgi:hypothetical protein